MSDFNPSREIVIAKWSDRFFAWLIDFLIICSITLVIIASWMGTIEFEWNRMWMFSHITDYIPESLFFFVYWIILEYRNGQSVGKKILNLKVVTLEGEKPTLMTIALSSFGKAFILPLDLILGWIFTNQKRQRIFNKISDTIVIKIKQEGNSEEISYKKD